jgi:hypothetical protein
VDQSAAPEKMAEIANRVRERLQKGQDITKPMKMGVMAESKAAEEEAKPATGEGLGDLLKTGLKLGKKAVAVGKKYATKENLEKVKKAAKTAKELYDTAEKAGLTKGSTKEKLAKVKEMAKAEAMSRAKKALKDTDEDGVPDSKDKDDDGDGVPDTEEKRGGAGKLPDDTKAALRAEFDKQGAKLGQRMFFVVQIPSKTGRYYVVTRTGHDIGDYEKKEDADAWVKAIDPSFPLEGDGLGSLMKSLGKAVKKGAKVAKKYATKENLEKLQKAAKTGAEIYGAVKEAGLTSGTKEEKLARAKSLAKSALMAKLKGEPEEEEEEPQEEAEPEGGRKPKRRRAPSKRNMMVAKVMKERGVGLGEASRIVKEEGLA